MTNIYNLETCDLNKALSAIWSQIKLESNNIYFAKSPEFIKNMNQSHRDIVLLVIQKLSRTSYNFIDAPILYDGRQTVKKNNVIIDKNTTGSFINRESGVMNIRSITRVSDAIVKFIKKLPRGSFIYSFVFADSPTPGFEIKYIEASKNDLSVLTTDIEQELTRRIKWLLTNKAKFVDYDKHRLERVVMTKEFDLNQFKDIDNLDDKILIIANNVAIFIFVNKLLEIQKIDYCLEDKILKVNITSYR